MERHVDFTLKELDKVAGDEDALASLCADKLSIAYEQAGQYFSLADHYFMLLSTDLRAAVRRKLAEPPHTRPPWAQVLRFTVTLPRPGSVGVGRYEQVVSV